MEHIQLTSKSKLHRAHADTNTNTRPIHHHAVLCCLPKAASRVDPVHGSVFTPAKTRPLSIVNTDNRLIANVFRLMLEPIINQWVSDMQRGFLTGRSMLSNVVDIDLEAMRISLKHPRGSIILFDFAAAFPSLSQEYMWQVLSHIGLPPGILEAIQSLYVNNVHFVKVKSCLFPSLTATSGVRQGCPLSPLLFAIVADLLLRRLKNRLPQALVRAFADDTGVVVPDFASYAPTIMSIFQEFAKISNLALNLSKTVLIPLWESSADSISADGFEVICLTGLVWKSLGQHVTWAITLAHRGCPRVGTKHMRSLKNA